MKGQELKIIFRDDLAFLTEEVALDFNQVEIPQPSAKFKAPAFWTVRVINYIEDERKLFVEVLLYQVGETEVPIDQIELADQLMSIEKVTFKSIDTTGWLNTLYSKVPIKVSQPRPETVCREETTMLPSAQIDRDTIKQTYNESFSIAIKDIRFLSGKVVFEKKLEQLKKLIRFEIINDHIIEEYDAVKNYFASVLKTKKIQVVSTIMTDGGIITSINTTSNEIDRIDRSFIEEIKFNVLKTAKKNEPNNDKQLFTMEEYLETFAKEDFNVQQLFKGENDFFENLLEKSETKHYKHLRFLSSKHQADMQKLRFVHKPFSFVFLLSGYEKNYIVWETLDTQEATYIWTVGKEVKDVEHALAQTEKTIHLIVKDGKSEYIRRNEANFHRVFHDYTDLHNGFKNWKAEIEKVTL